MSGGGVMYYDDTWVIGMLGLAQCTHTKYVVGVYEINVSVVRVCMYMCVSERVCVCACTPRDPPLPTQQHNTTLLVHRAPQLIADPAPNPLLGHHITQSHVQ